MSVRAIVGVIILGSLFGCSKRPEPPLPAPTNQSAHDGAHAPAPPAGPRTTLLASSGRMHSVHPPPAQCLRRDIATTLLRA